MYVLDLWECYFSEPHYAGWWLYTANKSKISAIWVHLVFFLKYWSSTDASTLHCVYRIMRKKKLNTTAWIAKRGTCVSLIQHPWFVWPEICNHVIPGFFCCRTPARDAHLTKNSLLLFYFVLTSFYAQHHSFLNAHCSKGALHTELFSYRNQNSSLHCCILQMSKQCMDWAALTQDTLWPWVSSSRHFKASPKPSSTCTSYSASVILHIPLWVLTAGRLQVEFQKGNPQSPAMNFKSKKHPFLQYTPVLENPNIS